QAPFVGDPPHYPGMRPFDPDEADDFFGRDQESDHFASLLRAPDGPQVLHFKGASGSGKSSLVRAGILPRLENPKLGRPIHHLILEPTADPFLELATQIYGPPSHSVRAIGPDRSAVERLAERLYQDEGAFLDALNRVLPLHDGGSRRVLFVDQLEELLLAAGK